MDDHVLTYHDLLDFTTALTDGGARTKDMRVFREVIQGAYRDLAMVCEWDYYMKEGRIDLVANQSSSTIEYDHTGSGNEREITLASGTWPSWAKYGRIRFSDVVYPVESRVSNTLLTLSEEFNPGADVSTGTSYNIYRSVYPLPADLWRLYDVAVEKSNWVTGYLTPSQWLQRERFVQSNGQTWAWTIMKDPDNDNRFALWVDPSPSTAEPLGFIYRRRPRTLRWAGTETEARTYTASGSSGASTITTSTALPSSMVGSVIRLADSTSAHPTGLAGTFPFLEQHKITALSSTTVTIDGTLSTAYSGDKMVVSDPVDMNDTMIEALKAQIEYRLSRFSNDLRNVGQAKQIADMELRRSMEAEARHRFGGGASQSRYHYLFRHLQGAITTDA
jgi:hypothetical protein